MKKLDYTTAFLRAIASPGMKQKDIACMYVLLLTRTTGADIGRINHAIFDRWSRAGMNEVKRLAWNEVERRNPGDPRDTN